MSLEHRVHAGCGCGFRNLNFLSESKEFGEKGALRPFALSGTARHFERDRPFAVDHLKLELELDFPRKSVSGTATLSLRRIDPVSTEIALDAIGFDLKRVTVDGRPAPFVYDGKVLRAAIPASLEAGELAITYSATPRRGLYFLEPDEHVPNRPRQVWSQCQEEDARHFLPCHDKPHVKMTTEMIVTVPNGNDVLSNGELLSKETPAEGAWRFHWKMNAPHPSYLLTLVAGEFAELKDSAGTVPLTYLVPKGREGDGEATFARTPDMVNYFGELTGVPYPWNKYAQVVVSDFIFGGMENTTATTMYEHILLDERARLDITSDDLIAHELAHQWFGDYVTCRDWSEGWLNEGFATFMEHIWREKHLGRDEYEVAIKGDLDAYLGEATGRYRRPIVCQTYDAPLDLFDRHLYEKGGLVLHLLRREIGDTLFWRGVGNYLRRHGRGVVETRDLMRALEEVSGRSLGQLFDQWVYRPGHPELEVQIAWDKKVLSVTVKQTQAATDDVPNVFEFPLELVLVDGEGKTRRESLRVSQRAETFTLPVEERPSFVVVDPEMRVLGAVTLKVPQDMLREQLTKAESARGRWLAAHALSKNDDPVTIAALAARLADESEFWAVRAASAESLGDIRAAEGFDVLSEHVNTAHHKVRRAVVRALGRFKTPKAASVLRPKALHDASYLVEAEAARALGHTKQPSVYETLLDVLDRPSWADVIRVGAIDGLATLRDDRALPHLMSRTRYGHATRARRAAILALPKVSGDRKAREALEELLDDGDPHLRVDVARALADLGDTKARGALRARLEMDLDPRVRRRIREVLRDLGGDSKRALDQVREELEKMQNEHSELKSRLALLEAKLGEASSTRGPLPKGTNGANGSATKALKADKNGVSAKKAPAKASSKKAKPARRSR
ncbi:HEAT repeat domain-containing protein [Pendulispora rubella]|uniref:Aminopeptidase N n=1 Tax=Pendulispora rubella TaxID=2741070 RepID=A0ABZ2KY38_9BACT